MTDLFDPSVTAGDLTSDIVPTQKSHTSGRKRSLFSRMMSTLCCCTRAEDPAQPIPDISSQGDVHQMTLNSGMIKRLRSRISKAFSFLFCRKRSKKNTVQDGKDLLQETEITPEPIETVSLERSTVTERPLETTDSVVEFLAEENDNPEESEQPSEGSSEQTPQDSSSEQSSEDSPEEQSSEDSPEEPLSSDGPGGRDMLRILATTNHWAQEVFKRYQKFQRINVVHCLNEGPVEEDILTLSRGQFLLEKKNDWKELKLREKLLKRNWQKKLMRDCSFLSDHLYPNYVEAQSYLKELE